MDGKAYRIRKPEWTRGTGDWWRADTLLGILVVMHSGDVYISNAVGQVPSVGGSYEFASLDEAKAAAEQWYLAKLREALIEASPASPKEEDR